MSSCKVQIRLSFGDIKFTFYAIICLSLTKYRDPKHPLGLLLNRFKESKSKLDAHYRESRIQGGRYSNLKLKLFGADVAWNYDFNGGPKSAF